MAPIVFRCLQKKPCERRLAGVAIECVGSLLELLPIEQPLNVAGDCVRRHDEGRVERMNIFAGDGPLCMADQGRDRHLREAEIIADTREAVAQNMGRDVRER